MQAGCNGIRPALFWGEREKRRCGGKFPVYIPEDRRYHKRRDGLGRMPGDGGIRVRLFIGILLPRAVRDSVAESARLLEQHGGALVLTEPECSGDALYDAVSSILSSPEKQERMARAMKALGIPDATQRIYDAVTSLLR